MLSICEIPKDDANARQPGAAVTLSPELRDSAQDDRMHTRSKGLTTYLMTVKTRENEPNVVLFQQRIFTVRLQFTRVAMSRDPVVLVASADVFHLACVTISRCRAKSSAAPYRRKHHLRAIR